MMRQGLLTLRRRQPRLPRSLPTRCLLIVNGLGAVGPIRVPERLSEKQKLSEKLCRVREHRREVLLDRALRRLSAARYLPAHVWPGNKGWQGITGRPAFTGTSYSILQPQRRLARRRATPFPTLSKCGVEKRGTILRRGARLKRPPGVGERPQIIRGILPKFGRILPYI